MNEIKRHKYLFINIVALSIVGAVFSWLILSDYQSGDIFATGKTDTNIDEQEIKVLTNRQGKEWFLPVGTYKFKSSVSKKDLKFLSGEIDPLDAAVGEKQKISIIVQSPVGVKKVLARIATDKKIKELELTKVSSVSALDYTSDYFILAGQDLKIDSKIIKIVRSLETVAKKISVFNFASAQSNAGEKWEATWLVDDTYEKNYKITFIAEDNSGLTNNFTLTWSDPCPIAINALPPGGSGSTWGLEQDCTILPGVVDGIENGNILIDKGNTIFVQGTFVFNPNFRIDVADGNIIIGTSSGGQIKKTYMWYCDPDGDGYTSTGQIGTIYAQDTKPACGGGGGGGFNNLLQRVVKLFKPQPTLSAEICGKTTLVYANRRYDYKGVADGSLKDCYEESQYAHDGSTVFCEKGRNCDRITGSCDGSPNFHNLQL